MNFKKAFALTLTLIMLISMVGVLPASAETTAVIDGPTANGLCTTAYPGAPTGPDQLSPCQWDMPVINATAATRAIDDASCVTHARCHRARWRHANRTAQRWRVETGPQLVLTRWDSMR